MPSYTAQVILSEPTHSPAKAKYEAGDVVCIYNLITEKPNNKGRLCFIHVHNVPEIINLNLLTTEISRPELNNTTLTGELSKRRAWMVDITKLTDYKILTDNKEININWDDIVNLFIRKFDGVTGGQYYTGLDL